MVPRRGDAVCTSRRCELRQLAAWAERVITRKQIYVSVDRVGVRHPRLQQFSPCLVAGSRQYPRVGEVELMAFLQRTSHLSSRLWGCPTRKNNTSWKRTKLTDMPGMLLLESAASVMRLQSALKQASEAVPGGHMWEELSTRAHYVDTNFQELSTPDGLDGHQIRRATGLAFNG
ncbi:hypothetical protein SprV_0301298600 [Sparganum proliferum]